MDYWGGGGGKYVYMCKACDKLGDLGACSPGKFDFGPFIRCNLGLFSQIIIIDSPQK